jgi:DNA-binding GntR family transcriptional regulator
MSSEKKMVKIEHIDLSGRVYDKIKALILSGNLAPGQKIVQEKLALEIGVSRTPLLKALQQLEGELLVESVPRRGMFVKQMGPKEIIDAFDCREGLEGIAARLTAQNITEAQLKEMKGLFEPFRNLVSDQQDFPHKAYRKADQRFHEMLIEISGNAVLRRIEMLGNVLLICYNRGLIRPPEETLPEHFAIIDAIGQRDGDLAEKEIKNHLRQSRDCILKSLAKESPAIPARKRSKA